MRVPSCESHYIKSILCLKPYQIKMFVLRKIVTLLQAFAIEKSDRKTRNMSARQDTLVK